MKRMCVILNESKPKMICFFCFFLMGCLNWQFITTHSSYSHTHTSRQFQSGFLNLEGKKPRCTWGEHANSTRNCSTSLFDTPLCRLEENRLWAIQTEAEALACRFDFMMLSDSRIFRNAACFHSSPSIRWLKCDLSSSCGCQIEKS